MSEAIDIVKERIEQHRDVGYERRDITIEVSPMFYRVLRAELDEMVRNDVDHPGLADSMVVYGIRVQPTGDLTAVNVEADDA